MPRNGGTGKTSDNPERASEPRKLRWRPRHNHLAEPVPRDVSFILMQGATLPWDFPGLADSVRERHAAIRSPEAELCHVVGAGDVVVQAYEREGEDGVGMCLHFPREPGISDLWSIDDDALTAAALLKHEKSDSAKGAARDRFAKELARVLAPYFSSDAEVQTLPSAQAPSDRVLVTAKEAAEALAGELPRVTRDMVYGLTRRKRDPLLPVDNDGPLRSRRFDLADVRRKLRARSGSPPAPKNSPQPDQTRHS